MNLMDNLKLTRDLVIADRNIILVKTAEEIFDIASLNFKKLYISTGDNFTFRNLTEISPEKYLSFARQDIKLGGERGAMNALFNAKRSIDCLIDNVLRNIGINPKKINLTAIDFCDEILAEESKTINPVSLKLFRSLGFSPSLLVSEVRALRNKCEHEFSGLDIEDVQRAFEIAELVISNLKAKEIFSEYVEISDRYKKNKKGFDKISGVRFAESFWSNRHTIFELSYYGNGKDVYVYPIDQENKFFYYFVRSIFVKNFDLDDFKNCISIVLNEINPNLDIQKIGMEIE